MALTRILVACFKGDPGQSRPKHRLGPDQKASYASYGKVALTAAGGQSHNKSAPPGDIFPSLDAASFRQHVSCGYGPAAAAAMLLVQRSSTTAETGQHPNTAQLQLRTLWRYAHPGSGASALQEGTVEAATLSTFDSILSTLDILMAADDVLRAGLEAAARCSRVQQYCRVRHHLQLSGEAARRLFGGLTAARLEIASCSLLLPNCSNGQPGLLLIARHLSSSSSSTAATAAATAARSHHHLISPAARNIPASPDPIASAASFSTPAAPLPLSPYSASTSEQSPALATAAAAGGILAVQFTRPTSIIAAAAAAAAADSVSWRTASTSSAHPTATPGGSVRRPPLRTRSVSVRRFLSRQRLYGKGAAATGSSGAGDGRDVLEHQAVCGVVAGLLADLVPAVVMVFACDRHGSPRSLVYGNERARTYLGITGGGGGGGGHGGGRTSSVSSRMLPHLDVSALLQQLMAGTECGLEGVMAGARGKQGYSTTIRGPAGIDARHTCSVPWAYDTAACANAAASAGGVSGSGPRGGVGLSTIGDMLSTLAAPDVAGLGAEEEGKGELDPLTSTRALATGLAECPPGEELDTLATLIADPFRHPHVTCGGRTYTPDTLVPLMHLRRPGPQIPLASAAEASAASSVVARGAGVHSLPARGGSMYSSPSRLPWDQLPPHPQPPQPRHPFPSTATATTPSTALTTTGVMGGGFRGVMHVHSPPPPPPSCATSLTPTATSTPTPTRVSDGQFALPTRHGSIILPAGAGGSGGVAPGGGGSSFASLSQMDSPYTVLTQTYGGGAGGRFGVAGWAAAAAAAHLASPSPSPSTPDAVSEEELIQRLAATTIGRQARDAALATTTITASAAAAVFSPARSPSSRALQRVGMDPRWASGERMAASGSCGVGGAGGGGGGCAGGVAGNANAAMLGSRSSRRLVRRVASAAVSDFGSRFAAAAAAVAKGAGGLGAAPHGQLAALSRRSFTEEQRAPPPPPLLAAAVAAAAALTTPSIPASAVAQRDDNDPGGRLRAEEATKTKECEAGGDGGGGGASGSGGGGSSGGQPPPLPSLSYGFTLTSVATADLLPSPFHSPVPVVESDSRGLPSASPLGLQQPQPQSQPSGSEGAEASQSYNSGGAASGVGGTRHPTTSMHPGWRQLYGDSGEPSPAPGAVALALPSIVSLAYSSGVRSSGVQSSLDSQQQPCYTLLSSHTGAYASGSGGVGSSSSVAAAAMAAAAAAALEALRPAAAGEATTDTNMNSYARRLFSDPPPPRPLARAASSHLYGYSDGANAAAAGATTATDAATPAANGAVLGKMYGSFAESSVPWGGGGGEAARGRQASPAAAVTLTSPCLDGGITACGSGPPPSTCRPHSEATVPRTSRWHDPAVPNTASGTIPRRPSSSNRTPPSVTASSSRRPNSVRTRLSSLLEQMGGSPLGAAAGGRAPSASQLGVYGLPAAAVAGPLLQSPRMATASVGESQRKASVLTPPLAVGGSGVSGLPVSPRYRRASVAVLDAGGEHLPAAACNTMKEFMGLQALNTTGGSSARGSAATIHAGVPGFASLRASFARSSAVQSGPSQPLMLVHNTNCSSLPSEVASDASLQAALDMPPPTKSHPLLHPYANLLQPLRTSFDTVTGAAGGGGGGGFASRIAYRTPRDARVIRGSGGVRSGSMGQWVANPAAAGGGVTTGPAALGYSYSGSASTADPELCAALMELRQHPVGSPAASAVGSGCEGVGPGTRKQLLYRSPERHYQQYYHHHHHHHHHHQEEEHQVQEREEQQQPQRRQSGLQEAWEGTAGERERETAGALPTGREGSPSPFDMGGGLGVPVMKAMGEVMDEGRRGLGAQGREEGEGEDQEGREMDAGSAAAAKEEILAAAVAAVGAVGMDGYDEGVDDTAAAAEDDEDADYAAAAEDDDDADYAAAAASLSRTCWFRLHARLYGTEGAGRNADGSDGVENGSGGIMGDGGGGGAALVVVLQDVTKQLTAQERVMELLAHEHKILEALFPRHVIEFMTVIPVGLEHDATAAAAAAAGGGGRGACAGGGGGADGGSAPRVGRSGGNQRGSSTGTDGGSERPTFGRASSTSSTAAGVRQLLMQQQLDVIKVSHLATQHKMVTILFSDVVGFTAMCKKVQPLAVMHFLNELYRKLDALLDIYKVYKVETIGDCYVVAGGLVRYDADGYCSVLPEGDMDELHAVRVMEFAKAMLRVARGVVLPTSGEAVQLRLGLHSGPAMSGVVGSKMPRFTVFGETVEGAHKMESAGVPGRIHVSGVTRALLQRESWEPTDGVQIDGRGTWDTHLWVPEEEEDDEASRQRVLDVYV